MSGKKRQKTRAEQEAELLRLARLIGMDKARRILRELEAEEKRRKLSVN